MIMKNITQDFHSVQPCRFKNLRQVSAKIFNVYFRQILKYVRKIRCLSNNIYELTSQTPLLHSLDHIKPMLIQRVRLLLPDTQSLSVVQ